MKINFNIVGLQLDLNGFINSFGKDWVYKNVSPSIPIDTDVKDLSDTQKASLIQLAIYECYVCTEESLFSLPTNSFTINN
jgi:hypothetical protein